MKSRTGSGIAECFSLKDASLSPLAPAPAEAEDAWTAREASGLAWLEKSDPRLPAPLYITGASSSTLDIAGALAQEGLFPVWSSVLSLSQHSGRGQMRRKWFSPQGNLYAALRLPLEGPFTGTAAAPAIGALLAEALGKLGFPVRLKWPNDLVQEQPADGQDGNGSAQLRKVAGILLEEKHGALTAGIGINLASCPDSSLLRDGFALPAGMLQRGGDNALPERFVSIFTLWVNLAAEIVSCYAAESHQKAWWVSLAEKHLAFSGCRIALADALPEFSMEERTLAEGTLIGLADTGALKLRTPHGVETFLGGSLMPSGTMPCLE